MSGMGAVGALGSAIWQQLTKKTGDTSVTPFAGIGTPAFGAYDWTKDYNVQSLSDLQRRPEEIRHSGSAANNMYAMGNVQGAVAPRTTQIAPPFTPTSDTSKDKTSSGDPTIEDLIRSLTTDTTQTSQTSHTPQISGGMGGGLGFGVPDFTWNPSGEQMSQWGQQGLDRARSVYLPQISQAEENLQRFNMFADQEIGRINPQYDKLNLAVANMIENTVKQGVIEDAIRRGAETSGELPRQLEGAGRLEVSQRRDIENERGGLLEEISTRREAETQFTGNQIAELRRMKAMQAAIERDQLERQARGDWFQSTSAGFEGQLSLAGLQNAMAAQQAEVEYRNAQMAHQQQQSAWERGMAERQFGLQSAQSNYGSSYGSREDPMSGLANALGAKSSMDAVGVDPQRQYEWAQQNAAEFAWLFQQNPRTGGYQPPKSQLPMSGGGNYFTNLVSQIIGR